MRKKIHPNHITTWLLAIIIFLVPSNLFLKFLVPSAFVNGLLVDYLIPKIYFSDIFIWIFLICWLVNKIQQPKLNSNTPAGSNFLIISLAVALVGRQVFTAHQLAAGWYLVKLIEIGGLIYVVQTQRQLLNQPPITHALIVTLGFQVLLSLIQVQTQSPVWGYQLLGEPNITHSIGLAKDTWWHTGRVLPYGTTAHPNILGGVLAIYGLLLAKKQAQLENKWLRITAWCLLTLTSYVLILTQSISALLAFIMGGAMLMFRSKLSPSTRTRLLWVAGLLFIMTPVIIQRAALNFPNSDSLQRRSTLQTAAIKMIRHYPVWGVGLNQFTTQVEQYSQSQEITRFVQPVHHWGLLWLAESGVSGAWLLYLILKKVPAKKFVLSLMILLPIAALDHYLLTQQTGLLLTAFAATIFPQKLQ